MSGAESSFCKVNVILISGKQGAGKTTVAKAIEAQIKAFQIPGWETKQLTFAEAIYEMHDACRSIAKDYGITLPHPIKDGNLLQLLGTEWGRKTIGDDVWVQAVNGRIKSVRNDRNLWAKNISRIFFIISDCRFRNEFDGFPDAYKVRLVCDEKIRKSRCTMWRENTTHESETDLDRYVLENRFDDLFETAYDRPEDIAKEVLRGLLRRDSSV